MDGSARDCVGCVSKVLELIRLQYDHNFTFGMSVFYMAMCLYDLIQRIGFFENWLDFLFLNQFAQKIYILCVGFGHVDL